MPVRCLMFQRDRRILLDTGVRGHGEVRDELRRFAELRQGAGAYHTYRVTDTSLWSAAASGLTGPDILSFLDQHGIVPVPTELAARVLDISSRYGQVRLVGLPGALRLVYSDPTMIGPLADALGLAPQGGQLEVPDDQRGFVKWRLAEQGWPVVDEASVTRGLDVRFQLAPSLNLRPYQNRAVRAFLESKSSGGVILLPCGSGKTVVGVAIAARLSRSTLIVVPSRTIGEQWVDHFLRLTNIDSSQVGWFRAGAEIPPVSLVTYQFLTVKSAGAARNLGIALDARWGLVIYDEVQSLPADVFRQSASLQSPRRLGLSATLVREDGREADVFALVGPSLWSEPWRALERQGWIAPVTCIELRIRIPSRRELSDDRILAEKLKAVREILRKLPDRPTLIVAHRLKEVAALSRALRAPQVTGETPHSERLRLFEEFRHGQVTVLVLSRVANVGVDLPDASLLIQVSGAFGSRQEEAQRLGRVLRQKADQARAYFYSLVVPGTREVEYASRRQRFLIDQGYRYQLMTLDELSDGNEGVAEPPATVER